MTALIALLVVVGACAVGALGGHLLARYDVSQGRCWCNFYCEHQRAADARRREGA